MNECQEEKKAAHQHSSIPDDAPSHAIVLPLRAPSQEHIPLYASHGSAGADIKANLDAPIVIAPGKVALIPTGLYLEIPYGYEVQLRPRSGLAIKNGISLLNTPATIDSDYRGEIKIILINHGAEPFTVTHGMRIAQMVIARVEQAHFVVSEALSETVRGSGGFGHTGVH